MPAPKKDVLIGFFMAEFGGSLGGDGTTYMEKLWGQVEKGWQTWQEETKFGGLIVVGAGGWAGVGNGGKVIPAKFEIPEFGFEQDTPEVKKFTKAMSDAIDIHFEIWAGSFTFSGAPYAGSSSHGGDSSGGFKAEPVPTPIIACGNGTNPSGLAATIDSFLTPPEFTLSAPECKAQDFTKAVGGAIEKAFQNTWLTSTMITKNTVKGPAASGSGSGVGTSLTNGEFL